ncbi:hypothetical protein [Streptomyces sp. NPDC008150]|uniref:hypothetical protein n=1 Tax=Streptomyces sp. NPDC008150 TaxID=3364816 RepID=UPI0036EE78F7
MSTVTAVRERLQARQQELSAELDRVRQQLAQLDTRVIVSQWWQAPSGPMGRGSVYHTGLDGRCLPTHEPEEITLYEALDAGLVPCGRCRPVRS